MTDRKKIFTRIYVMKTRGSKKVFESSVDISHYSGEIELISWFVQIFFYFLCLHSVWDHFFLFFSLLKKPVFFHLVIVTVKLFWLLKATHRCKKTLFLLHSNVICYCLWHLRSNEWLCLTTWFDWARMSPANNKWHFFVLRRTSFFIGMCRKLS